jgi:hypothetical protein
VGAPLVEMTPYRIDGMTPRSLPNPRSTTMLAEIFLIRLQLMLQAAAAQSSTSRHGSRFVPIALPRP